jgi:hypothetical protein
MTCSGMSQYLMITIVLFALATILYVFIYKKPSNELYAAPTAAYIDLFSSYTNGINEHYVAPSNSIFTMVQQPQNQMISTSLFQNPEAHTHAFDPAKNFGGDE